MTPSLLHLLHLSDTALPIGGFSHSAGLETYVQQKIVKDKATAIAFITEMLSRSLKYTDAAFLSLAHTAAAQNNLSLIYQLDGECTAVKLPVEMRQASKKLGLRLLKIFNSFHHDNVLREYSDTVMAQETPGNYCIAFGIIAQSLQITLQDALYGFYYNAAAGFVTNSVKLVPLGQQDGQDILFSMLPLIHQLASETTCIDQNKIGLCCAGFDIRSMQHEQLYSRLYMS